MIETFNFRMTDYDRKVPEVLHGKKIMDLRNGIVCKEPTLDFECYLNYLQLLNSMRDKWVNTGYLQLGMIPVIMAPQFMHNSFFETFLRMNDVDIKFHTMQSVSLMKSNYITRDHDLWVFREDAARVVGTETINSIKFLEWWSENAKHK